MTDGPVGAIRSGHDTESWLGVPILAGDRVLGVIALESRRARNAFDEADVRLLSTLATSMGVALENARLFDETKRLLAETNERAAELAIINGVQQASPRSSTCRRCTTSSATRSRRSSTPRSSTSGSSTARPD